MKKNKKLMRIICSIVCAITFTSFLSMNASAYIVDFTNGFSPLEAYIKCYYGFSSETISAVHNSCLAWNSAHNSRDVVYRSTSTHSNTIYPLKNGANEITKGNMGRVASYVMETYRTYHAYGTIYEADINMNTSHDFGTASTSYHTQTIMTHEIGHLLGLGHTSNSSGIMYYYIGLGERKSIASDDRNGINAIYR